MHKKRNNGSFASLMPSSPVCMHRRDPSLHPAAAQATAGRHYVSAACIRRCMLLLVLSLGFGQPGFSQGGTPISGRVTDSAGHPLFNASVYIAARQTGSGSNEQGNYVLSVAPGHYQIVCRYLGYQTAQKEVTVTDQPIQLDFVLQPQAVRINEVVVHAGPDPAYAIIKKAIAKRPFYADQVKSYQCMTYVKGLVTLDKGPERLLGQKVDYSGELLDSTHSGIFFLTESLSRISRKYPHQYKQQVIASRKSGGGLGFDFPVFIDFYQNNMTLLTRQLSPRGYVSPIADHALHYYRYQLAGTFIEAGHLINKIKVIPRRKHEPLFSGYINIMDSSWRIHSLHLLVTRENQLEIIDSLYIDQIHAPVATGVWKVRNQSLHFKLNLLKVHLKGQFLNVYTDYDIAPDFAADYFDDRIILGYDSLAVKRGVGYWDSTRPVPLAREEQQNFIRKDSLARARKDSMQSKHYLDSLQKAQKGPGVMDLLWNGYRRKHHRSPRFSFRWRPLLRNLSYNTVEGLVTQARFSFSNYGDSSGYWSVSPELRYGWSNQHFNASVQARYQRKKLFGTLWEIGGGRAVRQINTQNPISPLVNSLYTLLGRENYMKIYEPYFAVFAVSKRYVNGLRWRAALRYEDRFPLYNTTDFSIFKSNDKAFTPNQPLALARHPFIRHQAMEVALQLHFQPGQRYIQYPWGKVPVGSRAPVFGLGYTKGVPDLLGSDVDFDKWFFNITDALNLQLKGQLKYQIEVGGFLNGKRVGLPDLTHFNGNQTFFNIRYLNSFQLAPYYSYSNQAAFYGKANIEYHLNGFLTNKIPLFNRLHWNLVLGSNAFYVNRNTNYAEGFIGLENIFKVLRVDFISGYQSGDNTAFGMRVGLGGLLGIGALRQ